MSTFQVVNTKQMAGTAKASGNAYNMMIVSGIFTSDDGVCEVGEITFMLGRERQQFPALEQGKRYTPIIAARSRQGKLEFVIADLKPVAAAARAA